jgi:hypothetical protein
MFEVLTSHPILTTMALCFLTAVLVHEVQSRILPLFIPAPEIEMLADELMANFGPRALDVAVDHQERAVWRSEPGEEGKWRRVARKIRRRSLHTKVG